MRSEIVRLIPVLVSALIVPIRTATAVSDCFYVAYWKGEGPSCPPSPNHPNNLGALSAYTTYDCKSGAAFAQGDPGDCKVPIQGGSGYVDHSAECVESGHLFGPELINACTGDGLLPDALAAGSEACQSTPVGPTTSDARRDGPGQVGDPINLRTGALSLEPVDVDLGHGLRFSRRYASNALALSHSSAETLPNMGPIWSHSLSWYASLRKHDPSHWVVLVAEPMRTPVVFIYDGAVYKPAYTDQGSVTVDANDGIHFTSGSGAVVDFEYHSNDGKYYLTRILNPGELPIVVTPGPGALDTKFSQGTQSLILTSDTSGRVGQVTANKGTATEETWTYTYLGDLIRYVVGPNRSTISPDDTVTWTYTYTSNRLELLQRHTSADPTNEATIGSWAYGSLGRVISADDQVLPEALTFQNVVLTGSLEVTVKNSSNDPTNNLLAVFKSKFNDGPGGSITPTTGVITSVSNTDANWPVPGGAAVDVPFIAQTTVSPTIPLVKERTDKRGNKTLFEGYDSQGRPGRVVEGWVDDSSGPGVFSPGDGFASLTEFRAWHPALRQATKVERPSVLAINQYHTVISDYDDPANPGNPAIPNDAATPRLYRRSETGYTLDSSGSNVLQSQVTKFTYTADKRLETVEGPGSKNFTEYTYDGNGNRTSVRRYFEGKPASLPSDPSSYLQTTFSDFDSRGNPKKIEDPNGDVTNFLYDTLNRVREVTPPYSGAVSAKIKFTYDVDENLTKIEFPPDTFAQVPYVLEFNYNIKNQLQYIKDSAGNAIVYERAKPGRVTRQAFYSGFTNLTNRGTPHRKAEFDYDRAGRLVNAFNPLFSNADFTQFGSTVLTTYQPDLNGNPESVTDENGKHDSQLFDALDRLTTISQLRGSQTFVTGLEYDLNGQVKKVQDPAPKDTNYTYDDFGRLVKVTSSNTGVTLFVYDEAGNVSIKKDDFGGTARTTAYTYDGLNRLTQIDLPSNADWNLTYDRCPTTPLTCVDLNSNLLGRLAVVSNGVVRTEREYTDRGDLEIERTTIGGQSYEVSYGYDATGNVETVAAPSGGVTTYKYAGARAREVSVVAAGEQQVIRAIAFEPFGARTYAEFPPGTGANAVVSQRSYNWRGQVQSIVVTAPAGTVLDRTFDYAYTGGGTGPNDPGPNLDKLTDNRDSSESRFYFYDILDRFSKELTLAGSLKRDIAYDANGNRTVELIPSSSEYFVYQSGKDRLQSSTNYISIPGYGTFAIPRIFAHDAYGNLIWKSQYSYAGQPMYVYDELNQLVEFRNSANQAVLGQYAYDGFGRRVRKITSSGTTLYFYDSNGQLLEERKLSTTPSTNRTYVWLDSEPIGAVDTGPNPVKFSWIHTDRLNNPIAVTSSPTAGAAQTIWRASYPPFGLASVTQDPDGDLQQYVLDVRFPGQYRDPESGLHYNWHRYYDPSVGRYTSADPIGQSGGINVYSYASMNPLMFADPTGLVDFGDEINRSIATAYERDPQRIKERATTRARQDYPNNPEGDQDSFRHCLGACETGRVNGQAVGRLLGDANESLGNFTYNQSAAEEARDKANNAVGLECALAAGSFEDCASSCAAALVNGRLTGSPGGGLPGQYNPAFPSGTRYPQRY